MSSVLVAFLSLVLLAPVIYVTRLGFTNKGKLLLIVFSLIFALLGILSRSVLALWQTVLLLLLFVILTTLWGMRKLGAVLYWNPPAEAATAVQVVRSVQTPPSPSLLEDIPVEEPGKDIDFQEVSQLNHDEKNEPFFEDIPQLKKPEIPELPDKQDVQLDQGHPLLLNEMDVIPSDIEIKDVEESSLLLEQKMDEHDFTFETHFPNFEQTNELAVSTHEENEEEPPVDNHYLAELEQLILDDDSIKQDKSMDIQPADVVLIPELPLISSLEQVELDEGETTETVETFETFEDPEEFLTLHEVLAHDEVAVTHKEAQLEEGPLIDNNDLHKQLFNTFVEQLHLSRDVMPAKRYEEVLFQYLHPELPPSEFYTIAMLVVQHYISGNRFSEVAPILQQMEEKVTDYPVLLQEIQFLKAFITKS